MMLMSSGVSRYLVVSVVILYYYTVSADDTDSDIGQQLERAANRTRRMALSRETCKLMPVILSVSPPPKYRHLCETVKLKTLGCKGTCHSYSNLVTESSPYQIGRTCSCCEPLEMGIQLVLMRCKHDKMIRRPVRFPLSCSCRPCFHLSSGLQIQDVERLLAAGNDNNSNR